MSNKTRDPVAKPVDNKGARNAIYVANQYVCIFGEAFRCIKKRTVNFKSNSWVPLSLKDREFRDFNAKSSVEC